jgi:PAS domain S-box-containing protein
MAIIITFISLFSYLSREYIRKSEQQSLNQLRQLVEMAYNAIHPHLVDYHWLRLTKRETIEEIRETLRHMTFYEEEGWNYIFMASYEGVSLVHTINPEMEMKSQWDIQDSRGLYIVRELVAMAKEKNESGGFVTYYYPAPGQTEPQEKVSFVMGIPEIDCYIGTGRYMGSIRQEQEQFGRLTGLLGILFILLFTGLIILAVRILSRQNRALSKEVMERNSQERQLSRLRHYLTNIIDSMPSRLIGVNAELIVTQWNRSAELAHGIKADDAVGRPLNEIIPWLTLDESLLNKVLGSPGEAVSFTKIYRENGPAKHLAVTVYPLTGDHDGGAVIMIDDISDRVRLEEMMVQSEKMLSVGGLAAGMAHEINNPLAGMMQTAEVLSRRLGDKTLKANIQAAEEAGISLDALESYLKSRGIDTMTQDILESGSRAALIIKNMLSFSRKSESAKSTHSIPELIDTMVELARTDYDLGKQFDFKSIEIVKEYAPDVPPVPCDGNQIQQVIFNLLKNGAEAMHSHATKEKRMGREAMTPRFILRVYSDKNLGRLTIEMEDNGPGMDDTVRRRVFEPFFTTKPVGFGTGLGLSVSYFIITETHGGTMDLESSPGKGARFIIQLPLQEKVSR